METRIPPATSDPGLTPRPHGFLLVRLVGASALTLDHAIIGTGWVGLGALAIFMPVQTYLIDAFEVHAASASAANTVLRSFLGAFLPFAGPGLYAALGNSVLGFVALGFTPLAWVILRYGERMRIAYPVDD